MRAEIGRLARRELRAATGKLRGATVQLKRLARDHKRRLARAERDIKILLADAKRRQGQVSSATEGEVARARITGKMVRSIRRKFHLSQQALARIVGVSPMAVYQWEHKKGRLALRGNAKTTIVGIRKFSVAEAKRRFEDILEAKKASAARKRRTRRDRRQGKRR